MAYTEPIRDANHVKKLIEYYLKLGQIRNYLLVTLTVHTALRISDILRIRWDDVYDFVNKRFFESITITEKKTKKIKIIALNANILTALTKYIDSARAGAFLIGNKRTGKAISRIQAYRIIRAASEKLQLQTRAACHALRKTFGYHSWKNGVSLAVIMEIYNHSSLAVTKRYLGITQDDINEAYLSLDFTA